MIESIALITFIALLLYILFGGADYGAGILDFFLKKDERKSIAEAIAAVWEANHVWLILVVVVAFNGFPQLFKTVCINLYIPLTLSLIGIIARGSAFAFRHYDPADDAYENALYNRLFQWSSLLTPFFLGISFGAMLGGRLSLNPQPNFYAAYIANWLYPFPLVFGAFLAILCAYLAAVLFSSENKAPSKRVYRVALRIHVLTLIAGIAVLLTPDAFGQRLLDDFLSNPWARALLGLSCILAVLIFLCLKNQRWQATRLLLGAAVLSILLGWVITDFPNLVHLADGSFLTLYNTAAPAATLEVLLIALITGVAIVLPALFYLFHTFKFKPLKKA